MTPGSPLRLPVDTRAASLDGNTTRSGVVLTWPASLAARAPRAARVVGAEESQVNVGFVRVLLDYATQQRCPLDVLAISAELRARLDDPGSFGSCAIRDWHALVDAAEKTLGERDLTLKLVQHLQLWHIGLVGYLLMTCTTLCEVGNVLCRFQHLLVSGYRVETYAGDTHLRMQLITPTGPVKDRIAMLLLGSWATRARWLTGRSDLRFDAIFELPPPGNVEDWKRLFGGKVLFGQKETSLTSSASALALPMVHQSPEVNGILRTQAIAQLERLTQSSSGFLAHIERYVKDRLSHDRVTLEDVATEMGCAPRTLQLRLGDYGVTFRALLDGVRNSQARHHLRDSRLNLTEIALMLGYADQAAFSHAFKRWVGVSPGEWRRRLASAVPNA